MPPRSTSRGPSSSPTPRATPACAPATCSARARSPAAACSSSAPRTSATVAASAGSSRATSSRCTPRGSGLSKPRSRASDRVDRKRPPRVVPVDYDRDPERFRLARSVLRRHAAAGEWVGVDNSPAMLAQAPTPNVLGEANALPFGDSEFPSVALLYVLYHLDEPRLALAEARRVLRPGGLVTVAAPSRHDSPELAEVLPDEPLTFDAELAPELLGELFVDLEVERWNAPLLELPTREAVQDYLVGKGVVPERAASAAEAVDVPLSVTKRGALAFARKPA